MPDFSNFGPADNFPIPKFWEDSFWEFSVQVALRDYCRPGQIVFDVGANAAGLATIMSRHVGPSGKVCAFEASPRIIAKTHHNLVSAGCFNTTLYYRAVYHTSHQLVTIHPGTHLNDSLYADYGEAAGPSYEVETLALDDFVEETGLVPAVIKMDIEGAEYDALVGCERTIASTKPILILEQSPGDMRCHAFLTKLGYIAVNLSNYKHIEHAGDFEPGVDIANVLFVHKDAAANDPYVHAGDPELVHELSRADFTSGADGTISLLQHISLPAGRYLCVADFVSSRTDNEVFAGISTNRGGLVRCHSYTALIAANYRDWVFNLRGDTLVTPYLQFLNGEDPDLAWNGAKIYRFAAFDKIKPTVVF